MASNEGDGHIMINKFGDKNFNLYKFKLEMVISTEDIWKIVEVSVLPPPSTASNEVKKEYEWQCKKGFSIIATSLVDKALAHIKGYKGPVEAWKILCNIHKTKSLSNILFTRRKFFTIKMDEGYEPKMSAHICFMFRIYLELHLECYWNNQKYKKSEAWCRFMFRP